jgi:hypothetical protein
MWKKYMTNSCVFSAKHKAHDSALWTDMLKVKDIYLRGRSMKVNNGERTHFWGDACAMRLILLWLQLLVEIGSSPIGDGSLLNSWFKMVK